MSSIARAFKQARKQQALTQVEVAEKAGIHPNSYAKIERGLQEPTFPTIKKIAKVLGLNLSDL
jgi:transcriptional regulator with XRE-family HTH domain